VSADQKSYDFKLREGLKFHNGDPFTADDVKFSLQRAKGYKILKDKVRDIEIAGPALVRFHLHEPWPDFMSSTAPWSPATAGSCRRSTSRRSATTASRRRPSASAPTDL
jgi:ABC-type transport system substrate-binding protein